MTESLRAALIEAAAEFLSEDADVYPVSARDEATPLVDALLPVISGALSEARQQGREDADQALRFRARCWMSLSAEERQSDGADLLFYAARVARGTESSEA